jgi:DNA-binding beta-propeller fold protein YncE
MRPHRRLVLLAVVLSLSTSLATPAGADPSSPASDPLAQLVLPGCAVAATSPAARSELDACIAARGSAEQAGTQSSITDACVVVPLVDDRCEAWVFRHDGGGTGDSAGSLFEGSGLMAVSPDSKTVFTLGWTDADRGYGAQIDVLFFATDAASGATRFIARHPGSLGFDQALPEAIAVSPDGATVFALVQEVTESFAGEDGCAQALVAFDASDGQVRSVARERGPDGRCAAPLDFSLSPSGARAYVASAALDVTGGAVGLVTAYDTADPARLGRAWQQTITGQDGFAVASAITTSPDGSRVYVAGSSKPGELYSVGEYALYGFDAADGSRVVHGSTPVQGNRPAAVAVSPDGATAFVVGGGIPPAGSPMFDIITTAFDTATGAQKWQANYEGPRAAIKSSFDSVWFYGPLALSPDGRSVYVAGYSTCLHGVNLCNDFVTLSYDAASGSQRWAVRYASEMDMNWLPQIAIHPDGNTVYTVGESRTAATTMNGRATTVAYDASSSAQRWVGRHSTGQTFPAAAAIAPDGKSIFTAGTTADLEDSNSQTSYDAFIVGYLT